MTYTSSALLVSPRCALRVAGLVAIIGLSAAQAFAQANPGTDPNGGRRRGGDRAAQDGGGREGGRGNFSPEEAQTRMLSGLRDRLGITNDEEWGLISKRITAVMDVRRTAGGPGGGGMFFAGGRGGPPPGGGDRGGRGPGGRGGGGSPEIAALQAAITDNLTEAEIKSRLERVREARRENEAKLQKAQEDLRAVLSVKQEATAVIFGLLP